MLSSYPENVAREFGEIDDTGVPATPFALPDCVGQTCAYYTYFQVTSMACPEPRLFRYATLGRPAEWDAFCQGSPRFSGSYGHGIVDAYSAVLG